MLDWSIYAEIPFQSVVYTVQGLGHGRRSRIPISRQRCLISMLDPTCLQRVAAFGCPATSSEQGMHLCVGGVSSAPSYSYLKQE